MATSPHVPQASLKELINGMLTLLEWQEQLAREALARLGGEAHGSDGADRPANPAIPPPKPPPRPQANLP